MTRTFTNSLRYFLLFFLFIITCNLLSAQTQNGRTVAISANCGGYYEYLPYDYDASDQKHPVIFYLHSMAALGDGSSSDLNKILEEGIPYYINQNKLPLSFKVKGKTSSFIVVTPQFKQWPNATDVQTAIDYILAQGYKIDTSRIYVTGYSMGGDATFKYAGSSSKVAGHLAAIATGDPYIYPYYDGGAQNIAGTNLPVAAFHCLDDSQAMPLWSITYVNKINSYNPGVKAKLVLFNGYSHPEAWRKIYSPDWKNNDSNLYEWFLHYQRGEVDTEPTPNLPPVAHAGTAKTVYLPITSVSLNGDSSSDVDGKITAYQWQKVTGPSSSAFNNPAVSNPVVSGLEEGVYQFELLVTDDDGATGKDTVSVLVKDTLSNTGGTPDTVTRYVQVNVYGGDNPYNDNKWNNWNVGTAEATDINTGVLTYSDGTASGISAVLSHSQSVGDNRETYGSGMAPAEVLRYTSYSMLPRTLTIKGLSLSKKYAIELYASRYSIGNTSIFNINGVSDTINVYDNLTDKASFANLTPDAQGQIVVSLQAGTYYTHLNGFTVVEQGTSSNVNSITRMAQDVNEEKEPAVQEQVSVKDLMVYPNPVRDQLLLQLNNSYKGILKVQVLDLSGRLRKEFNLVKNQPVYTQTLSLGDLSKGDYLIQIQTRAWTIGQKIIKL